MYWIIPTLITVAVLLWAFFWPTPGHGEAYGIETVFRGIFVICFTLFVWLIYFTLMWFLA